MKDWTGHTASSYKKKVSEKLNGHKKCSLKKESKYEFILLNIIFLIHAYFFHNAH